MTESQFNRPLLLENGALEVSGPFKPNLSENQTQVGDVIVRFLLFKDEAGENPVVDGVATWTYEPPDEHGNFHDWKQVVPADKIRTELDEGDELRAVGVAVQAVRYDSNPRVAPAVDAVTWCVNTKVRKAAVSGA